MRIEVKFIHGKSDRQVYLYRSTSDAGHATSFLRVASGHGNGNGTETDGGVARGALNDE
jgi:hypothetical protein